MDNYLDSLRSPLGRAVERTQRVVTQQLNLASNRGYYGSAVERALDRLQREFDAGVLVALARFKRARQRTSLNHSDLWQATVREIETFTRQMKSVVDLEGVAGLRLSQMALVNGVLEKLEQNLILALQQFQEALLDAGAPSGPGEEVKTTAGDLNSTLAALWDNRAEGFLADQAIPALPETSTLDGAGSQISAVRGVVFNAVLSSIDATGLSKPLTDDLKNSFLEAVLRCSEWKVDGTEPEMAFNGRLFKISAVCEFVMAHKNEPLPDNFNDVLANIPDQTRALLIKDLGKDRSYHAGARCVLRLVKDRNEQYRNST
jgi:hypothetical protein